MRTLRLLKVDAWRTAPPAYPHPLRAWLTSRGSLTARIKDRVGAFNLVRLQQLAQLPNIDERRELGLRRGELAIVREVLLRDGNTPLVFAHSIAARRDLRGVWRALSRLGTRPLAEMLFNDPTVVRLPMEYRKIDSRHALFCRAQQVAPFAETGAWARRSVFLKQGRPLLVTEVFLTTIGKP
jgi:chorismate--pyruvate lyase